jgi:hypothetical protein
VISLELIQRRSIPRKTKKTITASLNPHSCFNALLLALSLSLFIDLAQATESGNFAWENRANALRFRLSTPIALGAIASLIAFMGISPLFNRQEAGPFSLPALTLALTLTLTALTREADAMTSPSALAAMAFGICWLCWLRLLRLLPDSLCFVSLVVGACFVSETESVRHALSMHLGALVIMPLFIARLELNSAVNTQAFVAGFIAGIVYCYLTVFSDAPYSPLFALCRRIAVYECGYPLSRDAFYPSKQSRSDNGPGFQPFFCFPVRAHASASVGERKRDSDYVSSGLCPRPFGTANSRPSCNGYRRNYSLYLSSLSPLAIPPATAAP